MNPRTGRPKAENPRERMVTARLTETEHGLVTAAAQKAGQPLGLWMRERLLAAARRAR